METERFFISIHAAGNADRKKEKDETKDECEEKKGFYFYLKEKKNVGPTPTVPCVVKMKFPISSSSIFPKRLEMITLLTTTTTSQGDARVRYMHVKGNKGNRGCPRINKEPTNREKNNQKKITKHFPDHRDPPSFSLSL